MIIIFVVHNYLLVLIKLLQQHYDIVGVDCGRIIVGVVLDVQHAFGALIY